MTTIENIINLILEYVEFDEKELQTSTVYKNKKDFYEMPDIWNNRDEAIRVYVDLRFNDYTIVPF